MTHAVAVPVPEATTDLPEGWVSVPLPEVAAIQMGQSPPGSSYNSTGEGMPFFQGSAEFGEVYPTVQKWCTEPSRIVERDAILLSVRAPVGPTNLAPFRCAIGRGLAGITPRGEMPPQYLLHCLRLFEQRLVEQGAGSTFESITKDEVYGFEVNLPPLAEQRRIVQAIEALTARVDASRERLSAVPKIVKRFRQAVLAAACSGKLTEDWREQLAASVSSRDQLQHAREELAATTRQVPRRQQPFFQDWSLEGVDGTFDIPTTWLWIPAGAAYVAAGYGTSEKSYDGLKDGIPVLGVPHIASGQVSPAGAKRARLSNTELAKTRLVRGDVIVCRTNGSLALIGKAAVVPELPEPHACASYLIRVKTLAKALLPEYLHLVLTGPVGRGQIEELARSTAGQFNLSLGILGGLELPLPPLEEQAEVVRRVDALMKLADAIESRVAQAQARADKLTQSLLAKAFRGELVPTEAELARRESRSYETAEQLLARIKHPAAPQPTVAVPTKRPLPKGIYFTRGAIASYIIDRLHKQPTFGRVEFEKNLYLAEAFIGVDLYGQYARQAAGPYDSELHKLENLARKQGWFTKHKRNSGTGYFYKPGPNCAARVAAAGSILGVNKAKMDHLLGLMLNPKMDTERAEIVATLFAAWNDMIIDGTVISDDAIITEVRENWHEAKLRFEPDRLRTALKWMREHNLVPQGIGPKTFVQPASPPSGKIRRSRRAKA